MISALQLLDEFKLRSYVKTSGKTGLHVFVPVAPVYSYDQTRRFAKIIGTILNQTNPNKITMEWETSARKGKVFFDHKQNARGKTLASVLSARPTSSATVSMPIRWEQLQKIQPSDFTIMNVPEILKVSGDNWSDMLEDSKQGLPKIMEGT